MMRWAFIVLQLAVWQPVHPPVLHQGHWQSCDHEERVLEHRVLGKLLWELHMGPDDEFALYDHHVDGDADDHEKGNLLGAYYRVSSLDTYRGMRTWTVPTLHLWLNVVRGGGSRGECNAFYVKIESKP